MRFVSLVSGLIGKVRRNVVQAASVGDQKDVTKELRQAVLRINRLEAAQAPEATEFEVVVSTAGALVELVHKFNGPVRWYVVAWCTAAGAGAPTAAGVSLVQDASSTTDTLFLRSYVAGKAVVRVEPSQSMIEVL